MTAQSIANQMPSNGEHRILMEKGICNFISSEWHKSGKRFTISSATQHLIRVLDLTGEQNPVSLVAQLGV